LILSVAMPVLLKLLPKSRPPGSIPLSQMSDEDDERELAERLYDADDDDPLLQENGLLIERLRNELEDELMEADPYESKMGDAIPRATSLTRRRAEQSHQ
jgi:hypothetical protein